MAKEKTGKSLVIVESPSKSKTIEKYLGNEFIVTSCKGHIRDLKTTGYGGFGIDIDNGFQPMYKLINDKLPVIRELKQLVKEVDKVYLATDPDREGEAISWHLYEVLKLEKKDYERMVFNEVTKDAILDAKDHGRDIDIDLVHSQESRRMLDRIIGFSLSKLLQRKIGSKSAGRVQSVTLKLICDREKEIEKFNPEEYWEIYIEFTNKKKLKAKLTSLNDEKIKLSNKEETDYVLNHLGPKYVIDSIVNKNREKEAKEPYTTPTLLQDASSRFGFNSKKTMMIAQQLYEGVELANERLGLITYMRTDSVRLSHEFITSGKKFIEKNYGSNYYKGYKEDIQKGKNVQDAHEAIRPSRIDYRPDEIKEYLSNDEYKLYNLIYNRALAALMSNAIVEDEKVRIDNNGYKFEVTGERVVFDGYLKIYNDDLDEDYKQLPQMNVGDVCRDVLVNSEQKFTSPPSRYTEGRLINKMKELGIGRPSTYAQTIDTLKSRYYVKTVNKTFVPTDQGKLTSEKLDEYFSSIINVKYTAQMEEKLDEISEGKIVWNEELSKFYNEYMPLVEKADELMPKVYPILLEETCPECGKPLIVRSSRFGQFTACSGYPDCKYIKKKEPEPVVNTGIKCPNCEKGYIVERVSKKGRSAGQKFFACDQYPKCRTTYSSLDEIER